MRDPEDEGEVVHLDPVTHYGLSIIAAQAGITIAQLAAMLLRDIVLDDMAAHETRH